MKQLRLYIALSLLVFTSILLSACSGAAFTPSGWAGLSADQNTAYLAINQYVYAVNLSDGTMKWRYPEKSEANKSFYANPVLSQDGQVLIGSYNHKFYSLDAATGKEKWNFDATNRFIASALLVNDQVIAPNADGIVYAYDLTGKLQWKFSSSKGDSFWSQPVAESKCKCIYVASMGHFIYTIDATTGRIAQKPIDLGSSMAGTPALTSEDMLYIGTFASELYTVKPQEGTVKSLAKTDAWVWSGPALLENRLYVGDIGGTFYIVSLPDGTISKKIKQDGSITDEPAIDKDTIYYGTEAGSVYALDKDGNQLWTTNTGGKIHTTPVVAGDLILVAQVGGDSPLVALTSGGAKKWSFAPPK